MEHSTGGGGAAVQPISSPPPMKEPPPSGETPPAMPMPLKDPVQSKMYANAIQSSLHLNVSWGFKNASDVVTIFEKGSSGELEGAAADGNGVVTRLSDQIISHARSQGQDTRISRRDVWSTKLPFGKQRDSFTAVLSIHCGCTARTINQPTKNVPAQEAGNDAGIGIIDNNLSGSIPLCSLSEDQLKFFPANTFSNVGRNFATACAGRVDTNSMGTGKRGGSLIRDKTYLGTNAALSACNLLKV